MGCIVMSEECYNAINLEIKSLREDLKVQKKINAKQADIITEKNTIIKDYSKLQEENEKLKSENDDLKKSIDILRRDCQEAVEAAVSDSYYENKKLKEEIRELNTLIDSKIENHNTALVNQRNTFRAELKKRDETIKRYLEAYYVEKAKYEACEKAFKSTIVQYAEKLAEKGGE